MTSVDTIALCCAAGSISISGGALLHAVWCRWFRRQPEWLFTYFYSLVPGDRVRITYTIPGPEDDPGSTSTLVLRGVVSRNAGTGLWLDGGSKHIAVDELTDATVEVWSRT